MKKLILNLLAILPVCLAVSCSNSNGDDDKSNQSANPSDYKAALNYTIRVGGRSDQNDFTKAQVEKFLKDNGYTNVKVEMVDLTDSAADKVTDWKNGPEVYSLPSDKLLSLYSKGAVAKVPSSYANALKNDLNDFYYNFGKLGNDLYSYPYVGDNGYILFYNKTIVSDEQAKTVEGIIEACKDAGVKFEYGLETAFYFVGGLSTFGSSYSVTLNADSTAFAAVSANYNGAEGLKSAKAMYSLVKNASVSTSKTLAAPTKENGFGAVIDGSWDIAKFEQDVGKDNLGATKLPTITYDNETKNLKSFLGTKNMAVNPQVAGNDTTRLALDHAIANYLVSKDVQKARFDQFMITPTNTAQREEVSTNKYVKAFIDQTPFSIPQTVVPDTLWKTDNLYTAFNGTGEVSDSQIQTLLDSYNQTLTTVNK